MHYQTVVEDVNNIIEKYYREEDEYYTRYRYDENDHEVDMDNELRKYFEDNYITYDISFEEGFESHGYAVDFIAVAFEYEGNLYLRTEVFEYM